jgi:hypothetical protein
VYRIYYKVLTDNDKLFPAYEIVMESEIFSSYDDLLKDKTPIDVFEEL